MNRTNTTANARTKPLKRPMQARARFTVQAIYDAYVRIWQREGWDQLTTRKVALETGIAVGTLYEYFPSKEALHSGYVRHCIEQMLQQIEERVIAPGKKTLCDEKIGMRGGWEVDHLGTSALSRFFSMMALLEVDETCRCQD